MAEPATDLPAPPVDKPTLAMTVDTGFLTVIIVTKDRADDLRYTSLPSLAQQTCRSFDVLVWDASDDDRTCDAVTAASLSNPWMRLRHVRAQRTGTSRQRNDALDSSTSDLVFFIDDDVELFPTAIAELLRVFETDTPQRIAGCQCALVRGGQRLRPARRLRYAAWLIWHGFWGMWYDGNRQVIRLSGFNSALRLLPPAVASKIAPGRPARTDLEWLQGSVMAFRRSVVADHHLHFDERLTRFGNYSKCEDLLFSGTLHVRYGYKLAYAPSSLAIHHQGSGSHGVTASQPAMVVYNHWIVWHELRASRRGAHLALGWAHAGLWLRYLLSALLAGKVRDLSSFREGLRAIREQPGES
jgi:GT2 family glycosyltransferase